MKKIFCFLLILIMLFNIAACSSSLVTDKGGADGGIFNGALNGEGGTMSDVVLEGDVEEIVGEGNIVIDKDNINKNEQAPQYVAGTLTAGEWRDAENLEFWTKLLNHNDWYTLMENRNLYTNNVIPVKIIDQEGYPCFNAPVHLLDINQNKLYTAVSDADGNAFLFYNLNEGDNEKPSAVMVGDKIYELNNEGITRVIVDHFTLEINELDLMLMIDTTGSMSDELAYLQKELENVIETVSKDNGILSIRISVNFYRDDGDEYIVRPFDFTDDISEAITQLNVQRTDGGGDYPEAVHTALYNIVQEHQWREGAVKLCFFVLDAPPHSEQEIKGINNELQKMVELMARKGIKLIPIASSGVNTETEFLLRSWALMTGGTYVFLTDHSGIGNSHLEPTIGEYEVEKLNQLMIRLIMEYCGAVVINVPQ